MSLLYHANVSATAILYLLARTIEFVCSWRILIYTFSFPFCMYDLFRADFRFFF